MSYGGGGPPNLWNGRRGLSGQDELSQALVGRLQEREMLGRKRDGGSLDGDVGVPR